MPLQANDLVPIVEPEILIDGGHSIDEFADVSRRAISGCIAQLWRHNIQLDAALLKPQMVRLPEGLLSTVAVLECPSRA